MDSWSFNSVVKGLASDQSLSSAGAFGKDHIGSTGWEFKHPFILGNNMGLLPNEINIENQVFGNINLSPLMKNSLFNPVMTASQNAFSEANESSCGIESKSMESGLIDLKLGSLIDQKEAQIFNTSKIAQNLSPSEVCLPSKRPRERGFSSSTPFCKVYGCNKNLSSCKEYHKRHKVCEVHSKTSKAIVNGIEQRFCQQCSRFHLLREFDDGKRSCRKRLAGHNERRRKPHVGPLSERHGRLLPSYNISVEGNGFKGTTGAISSFVIPNNLSSPYQLKSESNWEMNLEDRSAHDLQLISCITDEQLHSNSVSPCNFETNSGFINKCITASISSSESARSLLSSQSGSTSSHSSRIQTSNSQSHPMFPGSHDLNPMIGSEGNLVKFGIMNSDDQVFPDEGCTIDLLRLSSQLERVEHQKQKSQVNPANYIFHRKII